MMHRYRITYVESDHPTQDPEWQRHRYERAHSAEDAMTQFRVWAGERTDRAFPVLLETVEEAMAPKIGTEGQSVTLARQGLSFGGAMHWLRFGLRVRRAASRGSKEWLALRDDVIVMKLADGNMGWIGDLPRKVLNEALLATDWEVIVDAREGT